MVNLVSGGAYFSKRKRNSYIYLKLKPLEWRIKRLNFWLSRLDVQPKVKSLLKRPIQLQYRGSYKTKLRPRCFATYRGASIVKFLKVSRIVAHQECIQGNAVGIRRSSW